MTEEIQRFSEGEKILCFHGPLIYEAKIQKIDAKKDKYFIHYHGWNKNWDEWVPEARMLKYTELNLEKKRDLSKAQEANRNAKKASTVGPKRKVDSPTPVVPSGSGTDHAIENATGNKVAKIETEPVVSSSRSGKAKTKKKDDLNTSADVKIEDFKPPADNTVETEEQFYAKVEVKIKIPDELKPFLVDDWDYLTRQRKLVMLPSRMTVDQIIADYVKSKTKPAAHKENAIMEVTAGLREYFNVMLGSQLLYKFEREQHADVLKDHPELPMCKIYGPIHFLRLFVKLGAMLTYTPLDDKSIQLLLFYIHDFLLYIKKNAKDLFKVEDYATAPPEYHRRAL